MNSGLGTNRLGPGANRLGTNRTCPAEFDADIWNRVVLAKLKHQTFVILSNNLKQKNMPPVLYRNMFVKLRIRCG